MADLVTTQFLEDCLDDGIVSEGLDNFSCLNFMVMYKGSASEFIPPWEKTGLYKNLNRFFNQNYSKTARELPSVTDYDDESSDRVMMAPLCTFTLRDVQKVVYFFHQGEKLLLDTFQAPPEILSEIDTLSLNPEVKKQKISLDVDLTIYQKNNGVLLLWSSDEVRQKSEVLREDIWQSIFEALNLKNMSIQDEDVISFWRSRYPRSGELEYDEIRRVHFYNPTGMEKEIVAIVPQDFYLIKTLDCVKGSLEKLASKLIIKIRPQDQSVVTLELSMRVDEEIYVVFHLMPGAEGRPQEIGVPADPLFCWVSGAYYKDENIRDTLVAEKYESLFGIGFNLPT